MNSQQFLKDKKILLTSFSYALFGGAELNAVELADQLKDFGAKPFFFSYDIDGPLANYINKKFKKSIITDGVYHLAESESPKDMQNTQLNIGDYDYIWIGGNTIPISIIKQINTAKILPKFIFIHMSSLIAFPLDAPLMPSFEKKIASRILSVGERTTQDNIYRILGNNIPLYEWNNPVPKGFRNLKKRSGKLKRIAVISSNYPTDEVMNIKKQIEKASINIDYIGRYNHNDQIVDENIYDKYDLIVGIGKNVRYSLVSGVPIYIYGRHGGCGYLGEKDFDESSDTNFSGRGHGKKTSDQIAEEIINGYQKALQFHEKYRDKFMKEFSIDVVAERLFRDLEKEKPKKVKFSEEYINWLVSMQINLLQRLQISGQVRNMEARVSYLNNQLNSCTSELNDVYRSNSWLITKPMRMVSGVAKRKVLSTRKISKS